MAGADIVRELEPVVATLLERHLATTREWFPHELVPYSRGRDFTPGARWDQSEADLGGATIGDAERSALFVNLLTEDNLPYYLRDVQRMFGGSGAWGEWSRRWTAEEGRHSIVIRDYLTVTRAIDPVELERARMIQVSKGEVPDPPSAAHGLAYLTIQELATRIAHRNTGKVLGDPAGYEVMARVAADENLHQLFYRDAAAAAIEVDPSTMVKAIEHEVRNFAMPGTGIPAFVAHSAAIARLGIYDLPIHHEQILVPVVMRHWRVEQLEGLDGEAEAARVALIGRIERMGKIARRQAERRVESDADVSV